jgi:hypothetical protein
MNRVFTERACRVSRSPGQIFGVDPTVDTLGGYLATEPGEMLFPHLQGLFAASDLCHGKHAGSIKSISESYLLK